MLGICTWKNLEYSSRRFFLHAVISFPPKHCLLAVLKSSFPHSLLNLSLRSVHGDSCCSHGNIAVSKSDKPLCLSLSSVYLQRLTWLASHLTLALFPSCVIRSPHTLLVTFLLFNAPVVAIIKKIWNQWLDKNMSEDWQCGSVRKLPLRNACILCGC